MTSTHFIEISRHACIYKAQTDILQRCLEKTQIQQIDNGCGFFTGLLERLENGGSVLIAEGYLWEFERRGYIQQGAHVPEVVLEHPELVKTMHEEFVHAGTDVCEAFTYYGNREKLRFIGREDDLEKLNRVALRMAREVADKTGTLMAGGICNTGVYQPDQPETHEQVRAMYKEQVEWAVEEGADYMIAETIDSLGEAKIALDVIQKYGKGMPAVVTFACYVPEETTDEVPIVEACRIIEELGAAVVGLNCGRGPKTMIPLLREIRKVCKGPIAALPVTYRTRDNCKSFMSLKDPDTDKYAYPINVAACLCSRDEIREFAEEAKAIGVNYIGLCCGNAANYFRELAEVYGRTPEACRYRPNMTFNYIFGDTDKTDKYDAKKLRQYMVTGKD
ncbi:betaine--homocysteine S-methyltransferase 1-like isoform X1 [Pecten maximus]|uniref:betaine--homocysteine S-methyltransferase 1-like isoform X1 n=1 Tax=Pecten maximus TaxID=6579 RepID=UPI001457F8F5|nr:betaine--homocysteine S-methyltransferase 1-like isoform X1 [Pecten maximus]